MMMMMMILRKLLNSKYSLQLQTWTKGFWTWLFITSDIIICQPINQ